MTVTHNPSAWHNDKLYNIYNIKQILCYLNAKLISYINVS